MLLVSVLLGILSRIKVTGRHRLPDGPFILAPNHPSVADPLFVAVVLRRKASFMAKSEFFEGNLGRWFSRVGGFPVQRGSWDTEAFETAETVLRDRQRVMIMFLEGGVTGDAMLPDGPGMRDAKSGIGYLAQRTGLPVVPCWLEGSRKLYKPWTWPKVHVVFGEAIVFPEQDTSRESNEATADIIRDYVLALRPER